MTVDANHFRMVLENLVDNATKYTPAGGTISVVAHVRGQLMRISVKDTGVGIAGEDIPRLFEKFTRIPNLLSDTVGGSGLGLYWANKVVALHGGTIEVKSQVNKGTTFSIVLPTGKVSA
jgi:two-component system phosphate regulon sensor histidine kinase PhoR